MYSSRSSKQALAAAAKQREGGSNCKQSTTHLRVRLMSGIEAMTEFGMISRLLWKDLHRTQSDQQSQPKAGHQDQATGSASRNKRIGKKGRHRKVVVQTSMLCTK